jgi:hypothetical protein
MDDRTFTNNNQVPFGQEPSDLLKQFIEELAEEIVLNGVAFDNYKKSLRRYCEYEHFDGDGLIANLTEFFDNMEELKSSASKAAVKLAHLQARECYISASAVDKLVEGLATVRANKAKEEAEREKRKRAESERKAKEEAERRAREEAERKAKEESGKKQATGELNGHGWVDLGLPSGTLWATCNIGASKPEDYGDYFAWGETKPQSGNVDNWNSYKYANGSYDKLTKYCSKSDYGDNGFTDNQTTLQTGDDPATSWGSGWRTPSKAQWDELLANTTNKWTTQNGVKGRLFTAKNGQTLFLPAAGYLWGSELHYAGSSGYYWSRSLDTDNPSDAWGLTFNSGGCYMNRHGDRRYGFSVRPVRQN